MKIASLTALAGILSIPGTAFAGNWLALNVRITQISVNYANQDAFSIKYVAVPGASSSDACAGFSVTYLSKMNQSRYDKMYQAAISAYLAQTPVSTWNDSAAGNDCTNMTALVLQ